MNAFTWYDIVTSLEFDLYMREHIELLIVTIFNVLMKGDSSAGEHYLDRVRVVGSIPTRPIQKAIIYKRDSHYMAVFLLCLLIYGKN